MPFNAFDAVVPGMGKDGHTASFFADAEALQQALGPQINCAPLLKCQPLNILNHLDVTRYLTGAADFCACRGAKKQEP